MKKLWIPLFGVCLFLLGVGAFLWSTNGAVAEDEEVMEVLAEENTAASADYSEVSAVFSYSEVAMNGTSLTLENAKLKEIRDDSSKEGLKINASNGAIIMNSAYIEGLLSQTNEAVTFSLAVSGENCVVSIKSQGSTLYSDKGLCLVEAAYGGDLSSYPQYGEDKKVGISACYSDSGVMRWQLHQSETYTFTSTSTSFTDMDKHWSAEYVNFLAPRGIVSGMTSTTFVPNSKVTRGQFISFLARSASVDISTYETSKFSDVSSKDYYYHAVAWGVDKQVIAGKTETTFAPNAYVTREEMASMCVRYGTAMGFTFKPIRTPVSFNDSDRVSAYAKDAVAQGYNGGFINGKGDNTFDPKGSATRGESVTIIAMMIYYIIAMPH